MPKKIFNDGIIVLQYFLTIPILLLPVSTFKERIPQETDKLDVMNTALTDLCTNVISSLIIGQYNFED